MLTKDELDRLESHIFEWLDSEGGGYTWSEAYELFDKITVHISALEAELAEKGREIERLAKVVELCFVLPILDDERWEFKELTKRLDEYKKVNP